MLITKLNNCWKKKKEKYLPRDIVKYTKKRPFWEIPNCMVSCCYGFCNPHNMTVDCNILVVSLLFWLYQSPPFFWYLCGSGDGVCGSTVRRSKTKFKWVNLYTVHCWTGVTILLHFKISGILFTQLSVVGQIEEWDQRSCQHM